MAFCYFAVAADSSSKHLELEKQLINTRVKNRDIFGAG